MNWLRQLFCRHNEVHVERRHKNTVPRKMKNKMLYVDTYGVWNFVVCSKCGATLYTDQRERLHAEVPDELT